MGVSPVDRHHGGGELKQGRNLDLIISHVVFHSEPGFFLNDKYQHFTIEFGR